MFIVVVGEIFGPKTFHGPFDDFERADNWAERRELNK